MCMHSHLNAFILHTSVSRSIAWSTYLKRISAHAFSCVLLMGMRVHVHVVDTGLRWSKFFPNAHHFTSGDGHHFVAGKGLLIPQALMSKTTQAADDLLHGSSKLVESKQTLLEMADGSKKEDVVRFLLVEHVVDHSWLPPSRQQHQESLSF